MIGNSFSNFCGRGNANSRSILGAGVVYILSLLPRLIVIPSTISSMVAALDIPRSSIPVLRESPTFSFKICIYRIGT